MEETMKALISRQVEAKIGYMKNLGESEAKALLAKLRRGVCRAPGDVPELWGIIFDDLPEKLQENGETPGKKEWALYIALTMFALHQQGRDIKNEEEFMYKEELPLGKAVAILAVRRKSPTEQYSEAVLRRFNAMATAADINEFAWHLKGIITLLRTEGIALDYPDLAYKLYLYQDESKRADVRLELGRAFYKGISKIKNESEKEEEAYEN